MNRSLGFARDDKMSRILQVWARPEFTPAFAGAGVVMSGFRVMKLKRR